MTVAPVRVVLAVVGPAVIIQCYRNIYLSIVTTKVVFVTVVQAVIYFLPREIIV